MAVLTVGAGQTYTTIQAAINAAADGDEIQIKAGNYREQIVINKGITLVGQSRDSVIIEAPDTPAKSSVPSVKPTDRYPIVDVRDVDPAKTVLIKDITVDGRAKAPFAQDLIGIAVQNVNSTISGVHIKGIREPLANNNDYSGNSTGFGIMAEGKSNAGQKYKVTITNSRIEEFQKTGIIAWGGDLDMAIRDNTIIGAGDHGVSIQNGMQIGSWGAQRAGTTATISGNTIENMGRIDTTYAATGILAYESGKIEAYGNSISSYYSNPSTIGGLYAFSVSQNSSDMYFHDNAVNSAYIGIFVEGNTTTVRHVFANNELNKTVYAIHDGHTTLPPWNPPWPTPENATNISANSASNAGSSSSYVQYKLMGGDDNFTDTGLANTRVEGGDGNDTITTGRGNDLIIGGAGSDTLKGGAGNDIFQGTVSELNGDTIRDFSVGDSLVVTDADLTALNGKTATSTLTLATGKTITLNDLPAGANWSVTYNAATTTSTLQLSIPSTGGDSSSSGGNTPPVTQTTIDGVAVATTSTPNSDGTVSQTMTVPVVTTGRVETVGNGSVADIPLFKNGAGTPVLSAEVPVGFGLSITGSGQAKSPGASLTDLIREIKAHTPTGSSDQTLLVGGGTQFLDGLSSSNSLIVETIVPTLGGASTPPGSPLVITGTPAAEGAPKVALVIDGRDLPSGTLLQLHNVDFAVIIGNLTVTGGTGSQVVWGDSRNQIINLGADDDILFGGAGDDKISSKGGDDRLFGNSGRDELSGGEGKDLLHGGEGQDVALYERTSDRYSVTQQHAVVTVRSLDDPTDVDTLVNVETIRFKDKDVQLSYEPKIEMIARLYKQLFDRQGDLSGVQFWAEKLTKGASAGDIVTDFFSSQESRNMKFQQYGKDGAITLELLYEVLFSRKSDDAGYAYWQAAQSKGMSLTEIANHFAYSPEMQAKYIQPTGWEFLV